MTREDRIVARLAELAPPLTSAGACLSGAAAAHAHLAAATESRIGAPLRYIALPPREWEAVGAGGGALASVAALHGLRVATGPVEDVVRSSWPLFASSVALADGATVPVLTREAVLATLLSRGGLAIGLAGIMLRGTREPIDPDDVRELLKAARQPERYQPLLELLDVA